MLPYWFYGFIVLAIVLSTWSMYHLIRSIPGQRNFATRVMMEMAIHDHYMERNYPGATARRAAFNAKVDKQFRHELHVFLVALLVSAVILGLLGWLAITHGH